MYDHWSADLASVADYYPFGMMMPSRNIEYSWSRMGFNGKQKDDEVYGKGNTMDFGERIYDARTGRFLSLDPLQRKFPWNSPYNYAINSPITLVDYGGLGPKRLIFASANNKEQSNTFSFFDFGLKLRREYKGSNEYTGSTVSLTKVYNGNDIVRFINKQGANEIQTLDINIHGGVDGIYFKATDIGLGTINYPKSNEFRFPKNGLYKNTKTQSADGAGSGTSSFYASIYGAASLDDIDYSKFMDNAKVEINGCATAGEVTYDGTGNRQGEEENFASTFSMKLSAAGKKNAVVIGHFSKAGPVDGDYRANERVVFYQGEKILTTNQKGNISKKQIQDAIKAYQSKKTN